MNYNWLLRNNKYNPKIWVCAENSDCTKCPKILTGCPGSRKPILDKEGYIIFPRPLLKKDSLNNEGELEINIDYKQMEKRENYEMENRGFIAKEKVLEILKRDYFIDLPINKKGVCNTLKNYSKTIKDKEGNITRENLIEPPIVIRLGVVKLGGRGTQLYYKKNTPLKICLIKTIQKISKLSLRQIAELFKKLPRLLELDNLTEFNKIIGGLTNIDKLEMDIGN